MQILLIALALTVLLQTMVIVVLLRLTIRTGRRLRAALTERTYAYYLAAACAAPALYRLISSIGP